MNEYVQHIIMHTSAAERQQHAHMVVHCRRRPYDVYVGRGCYGLAASKFMNPFKLAKDHSPADRDRVCDQYETWLLANEPLLEDLKRELPGRVLACWCAPDRCHAHTLAALAARHVVFLQRLESMKTWRQRGCPEQELADAYAVCLTESDRDLLRRI